MKYPELIMPAVAKQKVHIKIFREETDNMGSPVAAVDADFAAAYFDDAQVKTDDKKEWVSVSGKVYISGDIAPDLATISSGECTVYGEKRNIWKGAKKRNPDGTVNYTLLYLQ